MKSRFLLILLPLLFSCFQPKKKDKLVIELKNPDKIERQDELITISRDNLIRHMGKIGKDEKLLVLWQVITLPSQLDDLDKDGNWDELAFLCDIMPFESIKVVILRISDDKMVNYQKNTNIRFARIIKKDIEYEEADSANRLKGFLTDTTQKYFQFEGPGWENDRVAFRNYFDERNGIDIFGKVTGRMVLDKVGINEDYHAPQFWGMDILKVGNSLGAGSLGIIYKDSLFRVSAFEDASFHIISEGPVRSILDFDFKKLQLADLTIQLKHRISIVAGEYGYRSNVFINSPEKNLTLVSGIVNLQSKTLYTDSLGKSEILFTHDKQTMNEEFLGMALIIDRDDYLGWFETPRNGEGVINTYAAKMKINPANGNSFRFYAGWEMTQPYFSDKMHFRELLLHEAEKINNPIQVILK